MCRGGNERQVRRTQSEWVASLADGEIYSGENTGLGIMRHGPESPESQAEALVVMLPEQWAWDSMQVVLHLARQLSGEILKLGTQVRTHRRRHRSPQMRYRNN